MVGAIVDGGRWLAGVLIIAGVAYRLTLMCRTKVSSIRPVSWVRRHNRFTTEGTDKILAQFLA
ncbi:unnamed protein product, partial [marine sediment metagenome]